MKNPATRKKERKHGTLIENISTTTAVKTNDSPEKVGSEMKRRMNGSWKAVCGGGEWQVMMQ